MFITKLFETMKKLKLIYYSKEPVGFIDNSKKQGKKFRNEDYFIEITKYNMRLLHILKH